MPYISCAQIGIMVRCLAHGGEIIFLEELDILPMVAGLHEMNIPLKADNVF